MFLKIDERIRVVQQNVGIKYVIFHVRKSGQWSLRRKRGGGLNIETTLSKCP